MAASATQALARSDVALARSDVALARSDVALAWSMGLVNAFGFEWT